MQGCCLLPGVSVVVARPSFSVLIFCQQRGDMPPWGKPDMKQFSWQLLVVAAAAIGLAATGPASAGPKEVALLSNYIGEWSGSSSLVGGEKPEPFSCRLT